MKFDVFKIINELNKEKYNLFVSERDLQLRFAMKAKQIYPELLFYPEYPIYDSSNNKQDHLDLLIFDENTKEYSIIEFKYVLRKGYVKIPGNDAHKLRDHSAVDIRRYQCYSDIARLETLIITDNHFKKTNSYFLLFTNEHKMWSGDTTNWEENKIDKEFSLHNGYTIQPGLHKWSDNCKTGKDKKPVTIKMAHKLSYEDYALSEFKYLVVKI